MELASEGRGDDRGLDAGPRRTACFMSIQLDHGRLSALRRYEDPRLGVSEEFLAAELPPDGSLPLLARPLGDCRPLGFVICQAAGPEQGPLRRLEAIVARSLAAEAFPVLRIRRGLAAEGEPRELSLSRRVDEGKNAAELLGPGT